ncbi:fibronectin type III domain-containing protein [Curtobacterium sp. MCPF17_002]|uniref:fibronectin type III domain-containing protein n=1 Tax=Curtobacterium sp. MCPF17_002 TaxID=2175645 RepID=UPI0015E8D2EF|nr:fibronectin type III domain-containing protein [Curtobacterium sp. MCPF17_002]WIB78254.1 fibronectin type III domain-containing protein [Curtobacterium sp. MCPF17_002]
MYRAALTVAAAAALVIGGITPAVAAPPSRLPGVPTSVQVSGAGDGATLTWNAPRTGAAVTGWKVTISPSQRQPDHGVDLLPAAARSDRFGDLIAGTRYALTVRATGAKGAGPAVRVGYTAPRSTRVAQSLFALDASGALVRFPTSGSGRTTTVAAKGAGFTADDIGDVFVPSADLKSILLYPSGGGAARTLATGLHLTADLRSDVAGNLYWVDSVSGAITKLPVTGGNPVALLPSSRNAWSVGRDGSVSAVTATSTGGTVVTASPRGIVSTRTITVAGGMSIGTFAGLLADGRGTLYLSYRASGGTFYHSWWALPAGSSSLTSVGSRLAYAYSATNNDSLVLGQSAEWCAAIAEGGPNACTADHTVTHLWARNADGTTQEVTTSGVAAQSNGLWIGAADSAGDLFVDAVTGATPGLWRVPAAGGAAQRLSPAQFSRLLVI